MTHWKPKLLIAATAILLLAAVPSTAAPDGGQSSLSPQDVLTRMQTAYAALLSYSDGVKEEASHTDSHGKVVMAHGTATVKLSRPNLYRIEWHIEPASPPNPDENKTLVLWSQGDGAYSTSSQGTYRAKDYSPFPFTAGDMTYVPSAFYGQESPYLPLSPECCSGEKYVLGADERVGNVECYVLGSVPIPLGKGQNPPGEIFTLWIGKSDYLLRRIRVVDRIGTSTQTRSNIVINVPTSREDFGSSAPN